MAIVQSNVLALYKNSDYNNAASIPEKIRYILKLYDEEIHIVTDKTINSLENLTGQTVNVGLTNTGAEAISIQLLNALNIQANYTNMQIGESLNALRDGTIAATIIVAKKSDFLINYSLAQGDFHLIPIEFSPKLLEQGFTESHLTHNDYPDLILANSINTVSVSTILATFNWNIESSLLRYKQLDTFSNKLVEKLDVLKSSSGNYYHTIWQDVDLYSKVPMWTRFSAMKDLLGE